METVNAHKIADAEQKRDSGWKIIILLLILILIFVLSFALGRYPVPPGQLLEVLAARVLPLEPNWSATVETVIFQVRLPRILAVYCKKAITDAQNKSQSIAANKQLRVYYAEGAAGLETDPRGSRHTEVLDMVGGINVAEVAMKGGMGMTPVSLEQVLSWNPDVILSWNTTQGGYFDKILTDSKWESISAVKDKKVYAVPSGPFNWFDRPPSVNRILGIKWLGNLLYPEVYEYDMAKETREFYNKFYHYDLSDKELTSLLKDSGGK